MTTAEAVMTAMGAMIGRAEMTEERDMTEEGILIIKNKIGIAQNVIILTFHSELNVIAVARKKAEAVLVLNAMTAEAEMTDVVEMTAEAAVTDVAAEMTEEVILIIKIKIGIVQNVVILTLHSELNVIAVVRKKAEEALDLNAMTDADVTTEAEKTEVEEMAAKIIVATIQIMIGNVKSVTIQISHSERNVIVVVSRKVECVINHLLDGKAMTEGQVKEKTPLNQGQEIGIVLSVENQILLSETTASVVVVQSE